MNIRKVLITVIEILILTCVVVFHSEASNAERLFSRGRIEGEEVVFDARDLEYLLDAIETGKKNSYDEGHDIGYTEGLSDGKNQGTSVKGIGSLSSVSNGTIDCTALDGWQELTVDDFVYSVELIDMYISSGGNTNGPNPKISSRASGTPIVTLNYNQETGQLTVSGGMVYTRWFTFGVGRVGWYHDNGDAYYDNLGAGCNITVTNKVTVYLKK